MGGGWQRRRDGVLVVIRRWPRRGNGRRRWDSRVGRDLVKGELRVGRRRRKRSAEFRQIELSFEAVEFPGGGVVSDGGFIGSVEGA